MASVCGVVHVPLCAILDNVGMACSGGVVHVPLCTMLDNVGSGKCLWCCTCSTVYSIRQRWEWQVFVVLYMFHCVQY